MESKQDYTLVAECLYRSNASGIYYALFKRGGKQIRKSLKTSDRRLAERLLLQLKEKVGGLQPTREQARQTFAEVADTWFVSWRGQSQTRKNPSTGLAVSLSGRISPIIVCAITLSATHLKKGWTSKR